MSSEFIVTEVPEESQEDWEPEGVTIEEDDHAILEGDDHVRPVEWTKEMF